MEVLGKLEEGHESFLRSLTVWKKQGEIPEKRVTRNRVNKKPLQVSKKKEKCEDVDTFFWISCSRTTQLVSAKLLDRPWWPAFICHPLDQKIARDLASVNRVLLCYVGREELYAVKKKDTKEYKPNAKSEIDASQYDSKMIAKYRNSVALARRICRAVEPTSHKDTAKTVMSLKNISSADI